MATTTFSPNRSANTVCQELEQNRNRLRIAQTYSACGAKILDFGVDTRGGLEAGIYLAKICLAGVASVEIAPADPSLCPSPLLQVTTDNPLYACMASQYAGWPISVGKFFAMGSGPMRALRGKEKVLVELGLTEEADVAVGVLECDKIPSDEVCQWIAQECRIEPRNLTLCVAPTRSLAGGIQVVARSIETSLHKLFELNFDLTTIVSAHGSAPLSPPSVDFAKGIGRTNDAILYGGQVTLWVDSEDDLIEQCAAKVPSGGSKDWGRPFFDIFREYNFDFYKVDPGLFSPAVISIHNLRSGRTWRYGSFRSDVLNESFFS